MKELTIDASKETYKYVDVGSQPTRVVFINTARSALGELHVYGNCVELINLPNSILKLYLHNTGDIHLTELPNRLEVLTLFTKYTTVDYLPNTLLELHAVDEAEELDFGNCIKLQKLVVLGREVGLFELPTSPNSINCHPIEERIDLTEFTNLTELILTGAHGIVLDLTRSKLIRLDLVDCHFQKITGLPDTLVSLTVLDSVVLEPHITLPDKLKVLKMYRNHDKDSHPIPEPDFPKSLLYYNGSSVHTRK